MITRTYDRRKGELTTQCPFGQRVSGILSFTYGQGDVVLVGSNACWKCPEFIEDTGSGVECRKEREA